MTAMNSILTCLVIIFLELTQFSQTAPTPNPFPPICNGSMLVNPPKDLSKPYYWPAGWNENMEAPAHTIDQICTIFFKVPKGLYAKLIMKGKMEGGATISLNDDAAYNQLMQSTNLEPYFFVNNEFYASLLPGLNTTVGTLGLKVVWSNFPHQSPQKISISSGSARAYPASGAKHGIVISASSDSHVSLLPVPNSLINQDSLRNTLVFDGPSYYTNYIGNLYKIFFSKNQFISTGNNLTIITFEPKNTQDLYVLQDAKDTVGFSQYTAVMCNNTGYCPVNMDAVAGKSAAISVSKGDIILKYANIDRNAWLTVFSGVISEKTILDRYSWSSTITSLPRTYHDEITQFVIDTGYGELKITK